MPDYGDISRGILGGLEAGQRFRANRQLERARDLDLESGEYDAEERRDNRRIRGPNARAMYGELDPSTVQDYQGLPDPFAFRLVNFFKKKFGRKQAISPAAGQEFGPPRLPGGVILTQEQLGPPSDLYSEEFGPPQYGYANGGKVEKNEAAFLARIKDRSVADYEEMRVRNPQAYQEAQDEREADKLRYPEPSFLESIFGDDARAANREKNQAYWQELGDTIFGTDEGRARAAAKAKRNNFEMFGIGQDPAAPAPTQAALPVAAPASRPARAALPVAAAGAPSTPPAVPAAPARAALPVQRPGGAPPQRPTAPAAPAGDYADFSSLDVDASEVPNMQTDDWKRYRAELEEAARKSGRPERVAQVNDMVTAMQQKGFLAYGQQGLALQQAGNAKGAMAAYRAAFQYFPNGNDVEFGIMNNKAGQQVIVGYGKDEKTGKVLKGSEIMMQPETVAKLIENFTNPQAFRMWTKDWRDTEQQKTSNAMREREAGQRDRGLAQADRAQGQEERRYSEIDKPVAQGNLDQSANASEAAIIRAQNSGRAGGDPRGLQAFERAARERLTLTGIKDEAEADFLASVMSQVKQANPQVTDNAVIDGIMRAHRDGTLKEKLGRLGVQ